MYDYDLIIIGGGSGGLVAAQVSAGLGARVALIDKTRLGGDCLHSGCVPSKTLIEIARTAHLIRRGAERGVIASVPAIDMPRVAATIAGVIEHIGEDEAVYVKGVDVRFGHAQFRDAHTLLLDGAPLTSKAFIIATGSRPMLPNIAGLAESGFLTNESVFDLQALPASLVVLGGGPVGCELAQAFARLGSTVTLIQRVPRLLPKEEPAVSQAVQDALTGDGVQVLLGAQVDSVRVEQDARVLTGKLADGAPLTARGAALLVATGRQPNVEDQGLEQAGVIFSSHGIPVDDRLRTSVKTIFAVGDVIGELFFTHLAGSQGGIAGANALLPALFQRKMQQEVVPWVTFTDPEAARVGLTESAARQKYGTVRVVTFPWSHIDRAQTAGETAGFIKLVLTGKKDVIVGAHLVGAHAGELLGELALAVRHQMTVQDITGTIHAYPTLATGVQQTAFLAYVTSTAFAGARKVVARFLPKR